VATEAKPAGEGGKRLLVVGAGPGGYAAAFRAADLGLDVTLVDPEATPGGVCLYRGCIPSKAYLHVARLLREAAGAADIGVRFAEPAVDIDRLRAWKNEVVGKFTSGLALLGKARRVRFVRGRATFLDAKTAVVDGESSRREQVSFDYAIVATGSRPAIPESLALESDRVMTSTGALDLPDVPQSLLVVGAGYIGLELGTVYAALGSRVTVVEMTDRILTGVDADLAKPVKAAALASFASLQLDTKVESVELVGEGVSVLLRSAEGSEATEHTFDKVLVSVGRKPNSSGLGLETTRVELDERGFVRVDAERRTAEPSIFAIGDVAGQPLLAHKATHEGTTAAEVIAGHKTAFEPRAVPAVVYTDPEVAWCGLMQEEAARDGREVRVATFPWQASGRALTLARTDGLTKLVYDPETEQVLGVGIAGAGAGELIAEAVLAIEMGAVLEDLAATIHPHPTLSETVMEAADVARGLSVHLKKKSRR
jgi:dihydrolipoamide dehydrogenase